MIVRGHAEGTRRRIAVSFPPELFEYIARLASEDNASVSATVIELCKVGITYRTLPPAIPS